MCRCGDTKPGQGMCRECWSQPEVHLCIGCGRTDCLAGQELCGSCRGKYTERLRLHQGMTISGLIALERKLREAA